MNLEAPVSNIVNEYIFGHERTDIYIGMTEIVRKLMISNETEIPKVYAEFRGLGLKYYERIHSGKSVRM